MARKIDWKGAAQGAIKDTGSLLKESVIGGLKAYDPRETYKTVKKVVEPLAGEHGIQAQRFSKQTSKTNLELSDKILQSYRAGKLDMKKAVELLNNLPQANVQENESKFQAAINGAMVGASAASYASMANDVVGMSKAPLAQMLTKPVRFGGSIPTIDSVPSEHEYGQKGLGKMSPEYMKEANRKAEPRFGFQDMDAPGQIPDDITRSGAIADSLDDMAARRGGKKMFPQEGFDADFSDVPMARSGGYRGETGTAVKRLYERGITDPDEITSFISEAQGLKKPSDIAGMRKYVGSQVDYFKRGGGIPGGVRVFDNGGKTIDRYTVIDHSGNAWYTMGDDATTPQGFNQYGGKASKLPKGVNHGNPIEASDLPMEVQKAIRLRTAP